MYIIKDIENKEIIDDIVKLEIEFFKKEAYSKESLEEMILSDSYILIVDNFEKINGYLLVHDSFDVFEIMKIAVIEKSREKGIGKDLINYFLNIKKENLFLEVREGNIKAIKFYEKIGFNQVGKRKKYYCDGETAILMMLERN